MCFILGLLAIKVEHQAAICDCDTLPTLVAIIKRYAMDTSAPLAAVPGQTCRRAADAVTNLAHENNGIKSKVRQEGGVPPLVALLRSADPKVQRAVAGTLRTLAFKNEENKNLIVELGALPVLIQMLHSHDSTIHYEAVGVIGNLVHSSQGIKRRVLEEGALQAVINLLSSPCPDSQREAALLLGQFATAEGDYKSKIVQRGAVGPLIEMLGAGDAQLREMAAFALGRLAQHLDNQAGIMAMGGLPPLLQLLDSELPNLQHNAAFALYGLSENEDNLVHFVREGAVQRIRDAQLGPQASRDCISKMEKRLQEKLGGRVLGQILYIMQGAGAVARQRIAVALGQLCTPEAPSPGDLRAAMVDRGALDILVDTVSDAAAAAPLQRQAAAALWAVAEACGAGAPMQVDAPAPPEPRVLLGSQYVNNSKLSDVTFLVEGRPFYAHRIALLTSSDIFRSMFDGDYREKDAATIPIPNIRWEVFEAMMHCIYTGSVAVPAELAQELLEAADQYMLETPKRLCEAAIAAQLAPDNVAAAFDLAENFNAAELAKRCALFCLHSYDAMQAAPEGGPAAYAGVVARMAKPLREALAADIKAHAEREPEGMMVL